METGQRRDPPRSVAGAAALGLALSTGLFCASCGDSSQKSQADPVPPLAKAVIRTAKSYLPEEEARRRKPKDCSDFVHRVYAEHGVTLPRTTAALSSAGWRVASARDLRMGDLVFFSGRRVSRKVGHVGIYVNNGIFIHIADPGAGVTMESLYSDHYRKRYLTARRVIE